MSMISICVSLLIFYTAAKILLKQDLKTLLIGNLSIAILAGYLAAILATFIHEGHPTDIACFKQWADMLYADGLSNFYSSGVFTDYPPGYMYVLYVIGALRAVFNIPEDSYTFLFMIKSPAIIANILTGIVLYAIAVKKTGERRAILLALFYMLNPMVLFNASVWGQVDAIHTLALIIAVYLILQKKLLESMLVFVVSALIKPQSFMFAPIYMYIFFIRLKGRSGQDFFEQLKILLSHCLFCAALTIVLMAPFARFVNGRFDFMPVIRQYLNTLGSYNYATVNAYNFYGLLGLNWRDAAETTFLRLPLTVWGTLALVAIVVCSLYLLNRSKTKSNLFFTGVFINLSTFMFSIKMHERYAFPVLAFLLTAYLYRMDKRLLYLYFGATAAMLVNCLDVYRATLLDFDWALLSVTSRIFSVLTVAVFAYTVYLAFNVYKKEDEDENPPDAETDVLAVPQPEPKPPWKPFQQEPFQQEPFQIEATEPPAKLVKKDAVALLLLTVVYAVVAFTNLGNTKSPQTLWTWPVTEPRQLMLDLGQPYDINRMQWLLGPANGANFTVSVSADNAVWSEPQPIKTESVFAWSEQAIGQTGRYVRLSADEGWPLLFMEMAFRDESGGLIPIPAADAGLSALFDEQALVPEASTYMNSTYFDEIYHARTAYEFANQLDVYEWTHPPLGKFIISLGVSLFGMTPFGWRFPGVLFGVLMLPLIYVFAKRVFKSSYWAFFAAFIFAFDFMHFVQTRIATIDTYVTFFIIGMYYFMYRYWKTSFYDTPLRKTLTPLFFSGLFMGLGIASKWPGVYAAAGLAVLFFIVLCRRYAEYRFARKNSRPDILGQFRKNTIVTLAWCVVFFVVVPAAIYLISYLPYYVTGSLYASRDAIPLLRQNAVAALLLPDNALGNYVAAVVQNQADMFNYHAKLVSEHDFASPWWSWPLMVRPIFYYAHSYVGAVRAGINAFGNPAVWWTGIAALFYAIYQLVRTKSKTLLFLIIAYLAQYIFWMPVSRTTYIYHYFPCVPFVVLLITYLFRDIARTAPMIGFRNPVRRLQTVRITASNIYLAVVSLLFILYYPVLTGIPVYAPYVKYVLRLFIPTWVLISY